MEALLHRSIAQDIYKNDLKKSRKKEASTPLHKDRTVIKCRVINLEDNANLTGKTITPRVLGSFTTDDDEEEEESSRDDVNDEEEDKYEDEAEEHLAPADSVPPTAYHTTAKMSMRAAAPSTYILAPRSETSPSGTPPLLPIPLPTSAPPLLLPSTDYRADVLEVTLPPRKRLCIALGPRFEVEECSSAPTGGFRADYGFVGTPDVEIRCDLDKEIGYGVTNVWEVPDGIAEEIPATDVAELGQRMTDFVTTVRQDTDEIYERLDDAQDDRLLMSGQLNSLHRDRRSLSHTGRLIESEAIASCEAWVQSIDASDTKHSEKMAPMRITIKASPAMMTTTTPITNAHLKALIDQGVVDALEAREADRSRIGDNSHNSGTGSRRTERTARECTSTDFLKCQPINFKGTERDVGLTQWFERMVTILNSSNCTVENHVKFATCTLHGIALTWWKSHVKIVGQDAAHSMPWSTLMKMMTTKYCLRNKIKKLKIEIWELKVKGTNVTSYTQRFQEFALMCGRMFLEESDKTEKYFGGLPDMIHGSVMASKPKTMQYTVKFATKIMDKKICTFAERETENKRKSEDTSWNNQNQQQQNKRQNTGRAYTAGFVVMSLRTTVLGQMTEIRELHAADRRRQTMILEMLRADHRRSTEIIGLRTALQGQVTALQGQVIALQAHVTALQGQQGLARDPTQPELPKEAGNSL
nr:hypothetical protein [Tanacetum cinerariifolium]